MIEALWSVSFVSGGGQVQNNMGAGVVVFETQRIFGGDSGYYYIGSYSLNTATMEINAEVTVTHYFGAPSSIFGQLRQFTLVFQGKVESQAFSAEGHLKDDPERKISINLVKRSELP